MNFCPKCNSDAPEKYYCKVCFNNEVGSYPTLSKSATKKLWWKRFKQDVKTPERNTCIQLLEYIKSPKNNEKHNYFIGVTPEYIYDAFEKEVLNK
jgi:hypothetical protein